MKKRLMGLAAAFCLLAALALPAHAQDYNFKAPSAGDFGTPTSDDTIYEWIDPNVDRSKNSALIPPGFGTPSSYLPSFGEFLTPNLAAGGPLSGGNLIPGTVGTATLPSAPGTGGGFTDYPTVDYPTSSGPVTAFTELTPDLYYSDGSLGTLKIPSVGLTVKIYEGTGSAPLLKGAGHFTGTTAWDGNYCLAGHNRGVRNDFGKIHTLRTGDTISLTTPMGTKDFIAPDSFDFSASRTFRVGQSWGAASYLQIMASELSDKLLLELLELDAEMTVTLHVQTVDQLKAIKMTKGKISDIDKMKVEEQKKAVRAGYDMEILPPDLITYSKDAAALLADLQSRNERMFLLTFTVVNIAPTRQKLENDVFTISGIAQKYNCALKRLDWQQEQGFTSSLVLGDNAIEIQRGMTTSSTAIFIPFMTKELRMDGAALYYGMNALNHRTNVQVNSRLLCFDIKALGKMLKKIGLLILTDQIWGRVTENRDRRRATWVYQDEFHVLLAEPQTAAYSVEIFRRFRKWGAIPSGITQNVKSLLESSEIESIFGNCDFLYIKATRS